jgi:predicted amidohydrolase YtcJ
VRDNRGRLTGELVEAACYLAEARSRDSLLEGAGDAWLEDAEAHGRELLAHGIVRVAGVPPSLDRLYLRAAGEARLPLTVHRMPVGAASMLAPRFDGEPTGSGPSVAPVGPAKLFLDGGERCALCFSTWQVMRAAAATLRRATGGAGFGAVRAATPRSTLRRGPDGLLHQGILFWDQESLDSTVHRAAEQGFQLAQHAVGNEAVAMGLKAIERAGSALDRLPSRPRLEHVMFVDPPLVRRIADAGVIAVVQPFFIFDIGDYEAEVPPPKPIQVLPLRRMLDAGVTLAGSSDYPVSRFDVLSAVKAAATRHSGWGRRSNPTRQSASRTRCAPTREAALLRSALQTTSAPSQRENEPTRSCSHRTRSRSPPSASTRSKSSAPTSPANSPFPAAKPTNSRPARTSTSRLGRRPERLASR